MDLATTPDSAEVCSISNQFKNGCGCRSKQKKKNLLDLYILGTFFLILGDKNSLFPVDPRVVGSMNPFQNEISPFTRQIYTFLSEAVFKTPVVPL